jgi:hypothetical protein
VNAITHNIFNPTSAMFDKLDDPECEARKMDGPTLDDGGVYEVSLRRIASSPTNLSIVLP